jgi:hypothetical protein
MKLALRQRLPGRMATNLPGEGFVESSLSDIIAGCGDALPALRKTTGHA